MRKPVRKIQDETNDVCDDCIYQEWYSVHWNIGADGLPITQHCNHPDHPMKGLFRKAKACKQFKKKQQ